MATPRSMSTSSTGSRHRGCYEAQVGGVGDDGVGMGVLRPAAWRTPATISQPTAIRITDAAGGVGGAAGTTWLGPRSLEWRWPRPTRAPRRSGPWIWRPR